MGILRHTIYSILSISLLAGCYREYTGVIKTTPVLCISSLITAGEPIEVTVTHTWAYPDEDYSYSNEKYFNNKVDDAVVEIFANNQLVDSDYLPKQGDNIRIVATSKKYGKAEGEVTVPKAVAINSAKWDANKVSKSDYSFIFDFDAKLTIVDDTDIENYYRISYSTSNDNIDIDDNYYSDYYYTDYLFPGDLTYLKLGELDYQSEPIFSEHIGTINNFIGNDAYGFTFFTDQRFPDDRYTLNLEFENMTLKFGADGFSESDLDWDMCFTLSTVTESYYSYVLYQWESQNGVITDLGDLGLGDPVWGYSNVSTGAGVIAAKSDSEYKINLKDYFLSQIEQ